MSQGRGFVFLSKDEMGRRPNGVIIYKDILIPVKGILNIWSNEDNKQLAWYIDLSQSLNVRRADFLLIENERNLKKSLQ